MDLPHAARRGAPDRVGRLDRQEGQLTLKETSARLVASIALLLAFDAAAFAPEAPPAEAARAARQARMSAVDLFALADAARDRGDFGTAEEAYRALAGDPSTEVRLEARFRLGMMIASLGRRTEAATLFRQILDERPDAQRVRLELARLLDQLGDDAGARRALREAQAGGLPPEVAILVDRYSEALRAEKPVGASIEFALAPDTNINRATRSDTLGTVFGDFELNESARERSGVGATVRGQAYVRANLDERVALLARLGGSADLYRQSEFNDVALGIGGGPEFSFGPDRLAAQAGVTWRWYGNQSYSTTPNIALNHVHPLDRQSQLRTAASFGAIDNSRNPLQDGESYAVSASYERALSYDAGIDFSVAADRQDLRDPGYSSTGGQVTLLAYRDFGAATVIGAVTYGRLEADERLFIYPERRVDDLYRASLGVTLRRFAIGEYAPVVRLIAERNRSSIEIFDYRRLRAEFGFVRAF